MQDLNETRICEGKDKTSPNESHQRLLVSLELPRTYYDTMKYS